AAIAIAAEWLCRKEACPRGITDRASAFAMKERTKALRSIAQHLELRAYDDRFDVAVVRRLPKKINRHHRAWPQLSLLAHHGDGGFEALPIEVVGVLEHIDEYAGRAHQCDHFCRRGKGESRYEDGITWADSPGAENDEQRVRTIGASDHVLDAGKF